MFRILFVLMIATSCTYRFTNQHIQVPKGIKTIAFEAIYDTSRVVIPHEILWESLQKAFARDGHLRLTSQGRADALLRVHIRRGSIRPSGNNEIHGPRKDDLNGDQKISDRVRDLNRAGEYTKTSLLSYTIHVEVIDLYAKEIIFLRDYTQAANFNTNFPDQIVQDRSKFLRHEEQLTAKFKDLSDQVSKQIVRDFVVGR